VAGLRSPLAASFAATAIEPPTTTSVSTTVDTSSPTLPVAPLDEPLGPPAPRRSRWPWVLGGLATSVIIISLVAAVIEVPYYAISPGSARPAGPIVLVEGAETYENDDILFTTVSLAPGPEEDRHLNGWEWLQAELDDDIDLVDADLVDAGRTPAENGEVNQALMDESTDVAVIVALEHLGFDVIDGTGATVADVVPDFPAEGVIQPGDTVVRANGEPVERAEDLATAIDDLEPGDELSMVVEPEDGPRRREQVELAEDPRAPESAFLGVVGLSTRDEVRHYPFDVSIDPGRVRGPSAGLAFTLAVLDVLTPGDLSGGHEVAVTGTIDGLGRVGPIGGAQYKAIAARSAGAELFLVPAGEEEQAREKVGDDLRIVPVETLQDALDALADLGGNALDLERPVPSAS
jgi:Lon-like protease